MEGYKQITREDLTKILDVARDSIVSLEIVNFAQGSVFFNKFDYGIYMNKNGETVLSLTSEEIEDSWDLYLDEVEEMLIDEDIEIDGEIGEYTYEDVCGEMILFRYYNGLMVMIEICG
jgi:hypothetical protein